jgi:hypothetical protein
MIHISELANQRPLIVGLAFLIIGAIGILLAPMTARSQVRTTTRILRHIPRWMSRSLQLEAYTSLEHTVLTIRVGAIGFLVVGLLIFSLLVTHVAR